MHEVYAIVSGLVQGVAYRYYLQDAATELELTGWVKNLSDGTVEVLAQGNQDVLKEFIEYLHEGSLRAKVETVAAEWRSPKKLYEEFSIKH